MIEAFEMVTDGACKPMWTDRKGQGYCGLMKHRCHPVHLGMECWDQYEMTDSAPKLWIVVMMVSALLILLLLLLKFTLCQRKSEQVESDSESEDERWLDPAWCAISMFQLLELHDKAGTECNDLNDPTYMYRAMRICIFNGMYMH